MTDNLREKDQLLRTQQDLIGDLKLQLERAEERCKIQNREIIGLKEQNETVI